MYYRICWRNNTIRNTGHGEYCLSLTNALAWIKRLNEKYLDMTHWMEADPDPGPKCTLIRESLYGC